MFHEEAITRRNIRENLSIQKNLESAEFLQKGRNWKANVADIKDTNISSTTIHVEKQNKKRNREVMFKEGELGSLLRQKEQNKIAHTEAELFKEDSTQQSEWERLKHLDVLAPIDAPGEMGNPVKINLSQLTSSEKNKYEQLYKLNSFNQYASDMISYHRRLMDIRNDQCKAKTYRKDLPNTSVIICFHNEAWSVLVRTVHSILDRSPEHLIHEIILVDDYSDLDHLKKPLEDYLSTLKKVKVIRTKQREGLVRARLLGYSISTGDTLTFLDSHIECYPGWLEPLLDRIATNSTIAVAPIIPMINELTFGAQKVEAAAVSVGGFDIEKMAFNWVSLPKKTRVASKTDPIKTPTIAGGLFTISRDFFKTIGTYDEGMDIWGGENLEISFRIWMCGGSLEIHPCSAVAHVFRTTSPYKWGKSFFDILRHNAVRVAEVWMDEYKNYYYEKLNFNLGNYGDVSSRKELRKNLNCQSFDWYVKNIFPNLKLPEKSTYAGELKSVLITEVCIDSMGLKSASTEVLGQPCHGFGGNQHFRMTADGSVGRDDTCLDYNSNQQKLHLVDCNGSTTQVWEYTKDQQLRLKLWDLCLELASNRRSLLLQKCEVLPQQQWTWTKKY